MPEKHIVDRYLEAVKPLGVEDDGLGLDYFTPEEDRISFEELPGTHRSGYIGIAIGAALATKKLPLHKLTELCMSVNYPVVL